MIPKQPLSEEQNKERNKKKDVKTVPRLTYLSKLKPREDKQDRRTQWIIVRA